MYAFRGTFIKKNGEEREMLFVKLRDLPDNFISENIAGTGMTKNYQPGSELVWDVEAKGFRVFNWTTKVGKVNKTRIPDDLLYS